MASKFKKDSQANLPYSVSWATWLGEGEVITASTWTVPSGITKVSDSFTDTAVSIRVSGGTVGQVYRLVNHIVTDQSNEEDWSVYFTIKER